MENSGPEGNVGCPASAGGDDSDCSESSFNSTNSAPHGGRGCDYASDHEGEEESEEERNDAEEAEGVEGAEESESDEEDPVKARKEPQRDLSKASVLAASPSCSPSIHNQTQNAALPSVKLTWRSWRKERLPAGRAWGIRW